jgi:autotransporter-associated beta strand protein
LFLSGSANNIYVTNSQPRGAAIVADIVGTNGFNKTGPGELVIGRTSNNLTGTISLNQGSLALTDNADFQRASVIVSSNAALAGVGIVKSLEVTDGALHRLGYGPFGEATAYLNGILEVKEDVAYKQGSQFIWFLNANTTSQELVDAATGLYSYSSVKVGGDLSIADNVPFALGFSGGGTVDWSNDFWSRSYTGDEGWLLFDVSGTISGSPILGGGLTNVVTPGAPNNWFDSKGESLQEARADLFTFALSTNAGKVYLNYIYSE